MLQQASSLRLNKLGDHIAQNGADCVEPLVCGADIVEAIVIQQYLLNNEDGNGLAELRSSLHYAKAQRDNLGCEKEVDHLG